MSYLDFGYDPFLRRDIIRPSKTTYTSLEFDNHMESFSWNKGEGGVVKLGGKANASGYIEAYDDQGNLAVVINNEGLKIYGTTIKSINPTTNVVTNYTLHNP